MLCRLAHCASVSICCAGLPTVLPCVQILVYVVGIPVLFAAVLWAHDRVVAQDLAASTLTLQTAPDSPPSQQLAAPTGLAIRFLTQSYTQQHRYFEVAECFRRLALTGLLVRPQGLQRTTQTSAFDSDVDHLDVATCGSY
eukprot:TRINITY_DN323_c0_g4_i2.p1 TRINITY_DN323_c0_g4~~TRINITY_DN323_c0_g4_i2.p1  ORF type:complete len:140 (+),score=15.20 TRINITY_DN323_c0_g4_i2:359-778(+)